MTNLAQIRDQSLKLLKTGGKRIDVNNAMKQDSVAAHIINQNSDEPRTFEVGKMGTNDYFTQKHEHSKLQGPNTSHI